MRVLVTRPEPEATRTAARLRKLGHELVVFPLSQIRAIAVRDAVSASDFDAIAVTSANAIRHAPKELLASLKQLRCYAVGKSTAIAARDAGFADIVEGPGDAAGLAETVVNHRPRRLLYLTGVVRMPGFESALAAQGVPARAVEVYNTVEVSHSADFLLSHLGDRPLDAVLLYSATASEAFGRLATVPEMAGILGRARILCMSERVRAALTPPLDARAETASRPEEASLVALLDATG